MLILASIDRLSCGIYIHNIYIYIHVLAKIISVLNINLLITITIKYTALVYAGLRIKCDLICRNTNVGGENCLNRTCVIAHVLLGLESDLANVSLSTLASPHIQILDM